MTPPEVLALAQVCGVSLWAGPSGQLRWRCVGALPDGLRQLLAEHKPALLDLLPGRWDQTEADGLLAQARAAVAHAEAEHGAGRMTSARRNTVRIWLEVCEGYARDPEAEARRGWDALALLRAAAPAAAKTAGCGI